MGVTQFRSVADMPPPEPRPPLDPENLRVAFEWSLALARLRPQPQARGVSRRDLRSG